MRRLCLSISLALLLPLSALAAEEEARFGEAFKEPTAVKVDDLLAKPDDYVGKRVRVEGVITDVCPKAGCWLRLGGDKDKARTITFKVKDGVMVFPVSAKGKRADVEGTLKKSSLTREQAIARAKHLAEEKKEPFDPKTVTGPETVYQISGTGAVIR